MASSCKPSRVRPDRNARTGPKGMYQPGGDPELPFEVDFCKAGQRYRACTATTDETRAQRIADRMRAEAPGDPEEAAKARMTWLQAASRYVKEVGRHCSDPSALDTQLFWLTDQIGPNRPIREIDTALLAELVETRRNEMRWGKAKYGPVSNATVNKQVIALLRRVLTRARRKGHVPLPYEPCYDEHFLPVGEYQREMTLAEERALRRDNRTDIMAFAEFLEASGLRVSVGPIMWSQVDRDAGVIRVRRLKRRTGIRTEGKVQPLHEVPITKRIAAMLDEQERLLGPGRTKPNDYVFTYVCQKTQRLARTDRTIVKGERYPITVSGFMSSWTDLCDRQGVTGVHPHVLRKTSGSRMMRATGSIKRTADHLDHADIRLTERSYAHVATEDRRESMEETDRRWRPVLESTPVD